MSRGSWFWPLVAVAAVAAIIIARSSWYFSDMGLRLAEAESVEDLSKEGRDEILVALIEREAGTRLYFRWFAPSTRYTDLDPLELELGAELDELKRRLAGVEDLEQPTEEQVEEITELALDAALGPAMFSETGSVEKGEIIGSIMTRAAVKSCVSDPLRLLLWQVPLLLKLSLLSLLPGIFGLIYRRSFGRWFLVSLAVLFGISQFGALGVTRDLPPEIEYAWSLGLLVQMEIQVAVFVLAFALRRHSNSVVDERTRRRGFVAASLFAAAAVSGAYMCVRTWGVKRVPKPDEDLLEMGVHQIADWLLVEPTLWIQGTVACLLVAYALYRHARFRPDVRPKNIVVCLDGTWNEPGQRDFGGLAETNVLKLFRMLKGEPQKRRYNASGTKTCDSIDGAMHQIAFYYRGVGNKVDSSAIGQVFGGAFGLGANAIVERAYLDVARVYRPGDRVFIFGFSRGAAIARLLAGTLGRRGSPSSLWTLRLFGTYWPVWRSSGRASADIDIDVLGCWDTVGAFGISKDILGIPFQSINLLKDLDVPICVKRAYHMVALDETRDAFVPTLMEPDPIRPERIVEVWFAGNHANVGGGYATDRLSNVTLDFLLRHVSSGYAHDGTTAPGDESWGMLLDARSADARVQSPRVTTAIVEADVRGQLRHSTGVAYTHLARKLPNHAVIADSVFDRMRTALPVYAPRSLFDLNTEIVEARETFAAEVERLAETESLYLDEFEPMKEWGSQNLTLSRWSEYLDVTTRNGPTISELIQPAVELDNKDRETRP